MLMAGRLQVLTERGGMDILARCGGMCWKIGGCRWQVPTQCEEGYACGLSCHGQQWALVPQWGTCGQGSS